MFNIGPTELIIILVIALIVFGPKRLPEIGRTVGKSLREFRKASQDLKDELSLNLDQEDVPGNRPARREPGFENWRTSSPPGNGSEAPAGPQASPSGPQASLGPKRPESPPSQEAEGGQAG